MPAPTYTDLDFLGEFLEIETLPLLERYLIGIEHFDPRVLEMSDDCLDQAFLPEAGVGRWPIRDLLGHLADSEMLFVHRMRRAVAEDHPVLGLMDENAFIDASVYRATESGRLTRSAPIAGAIATIHTMRQWHGEWLGLLSEEAFAREAMHPERGPESVKSMLALATWHLEHHAQFLNAKVERFLGPLSEHTHQGCGKPGCGCGKGG